MKIEINNATETQKDFDEFFLFEMMGKILNNNSSAIFVKKTHGRNGWVKFYSSITKKEEQKEISDLMIICFDQPTKKIKLCFLQAKYHRSNIIPFLNFDGDYLQLELLKTRPLIESHNTFNFPDNILNFSNYKSLTTYGIFYRDRNDKIDLLYTISDYLERLGSSLKGKINFPGYDFCPKKNCYTSDINELLSTCNIDVLEENILSFRVGAPVDKNNTIGIFIYNLLHSLKTKVSDSDSRKLDSFINYFNRDFISNDTSFNYTSNILLVKSDSRKNL